MNVIARLEYELAYYDSAVHGFNHEDSPTLFKLKSEDNNKINNKKNEKKMETVKD